MFDNMQSRFLKDFKKPLYLICRFNGLFESNEHLLSSVVSIELLDIIICYATIFKNNFSYLVTPGLYNLITEYIIILSSIAILSTLIYHYLE